MVRLKLGKKGMLRLEESGKSQREKSELNDFVYSFEGLVIDWLLSRESGCAGVQ